jgi:hypothetical protein
VPSHHQVGYLAYRGLRQPLFSCEDPATLSTLSKVLDNDPRSNSQCWHDVPIDRTAHRNFGWKCFVRYPSDFAHEVHRCSFAFQRINSEVVQNLECKCRFGILPTCREEFGSKEKLSILTWRFSAMAPSDRAREDPS